RIKAFLQELGHQVEDFGTHSDDSVDYPLFIRPAAEAVAAGEAERGIVLGGSGNGEAMVANRVSGIRCALCWNQESASLARRHNDANMLSLGARMVPLDLALEIVRVWLETPFDGGRHLRRIKQIDRGPFLGRPRGAPPDEGGSGAKEEHYVLISFGYILYSEGKNTLEFKVEPGLKHPTQIHVPSAERWDEETPPWAQGRREEILGRIRDRCVHFDFQWKEY
ncbi:MAG: RpiB/LacA/LacB family sugar-phosphate isomerase, partial [Desulfobacteraceae bacterium]